MALLLQHCVLFSVVLCSDHFILYMDNK